MRFSNLRNHIRNACLALHRAGRWLLDKARAWPIAALALAMLFIAVSNSDIGLDVTAYGLGKIAAGGYLGYWLDRWLFPYNRPHTETDPDIRVGHVRRRAIIIAACVIAAALVP